MEVWKDAIGYEKHYQVSNLGNVKSLRRLNSRGYLVRERILKPSLDTYGYPMVNLRFNNKSKVVKIHKLAAMAFLNHVPCGHKLVVNHIDFDRANNCIDNLEIITQRENTNQKHINSTSKYTGVCWCKTHNKWVSSIRINSKITRLGNFKNEIDAHNAYQNELKKITNYEI